MDKKMTTSPTGQSSLDTSPTDPRADGSEVPSSLSPHQRASESDSGYPSWLPKRPPHPAPTSTFQSSAHSEPFVSRWTQADPSVSTHYQCAKLVSRRATGTDQSGPCSCLVTGHRRRDVTHCLWLHCGPPSCTSAEVPH